MNEPLRTPELKFYRQSQVMNRDAPIEEAQRRPLLDPSAHMLGLKVG